MLPTGRVATSKHVAELSATPTADLIIENVSKGVYRQRKKDGQLTGVIPSRDEIESERVICS